MQNELQSRVCWLSGRARTHSGQLLAEDTTGCEDNHGHGYDNTCRHYIQIVFSAVPV